MFRSLDVGKGCGTDDKSPGSLLRGADEIRTPPDAVREAIVNAVCHRDYTDNGCVQVMVFRDRVEIINPGTLPTGWTVEKLLKIHDSKPRNEVIAKAMSWTRYVEKSGSRENIRCLAPILPQDYILEL